MRPLNIPGVVDYACLAQLHTPTDPKSIAAEVQRLAREQKLAPVDIATSLRVDLTLVREILAAPSCRK